MLNEFSYGDKTYETIVVLPVLQAFFYPPGYSKWASLTSTVFSISTQDWELLVKDIQALPVATRKLASDRAHQHSLYHELRKSSRSLVLFWRGVADAFI